jgi:cytochrome c oxidase cbb3-type subunit 1
MYSTDLINVHFWMSTIGTVLYIAACGSTASCRA